MASGLVHSKHTGLIAIERHRLAIAHEVLARGLEVTKGRLSQCEVHDHESAGGIVYINKDRALWGTIFKPSMLTTIDLNQLTPARTSITWLLNLRWTQLPGNPQPSRDLQLSHRLLGNHDAVLCAQLLGRQRGTEI